MKTIRASEIGTYVFCARAWWYSRQGMEATNQTELTAGLELHRRHGRQVILISLRRFLAFLALLASLVLLTAYCGLRVW